MAGEGHDWDRWHRARQALGTASTAALIVLGSWAMSGCTSAECIAVNADRVTTSLLGPPDAPPTWTIIDPTVLSPTDDTQYIYPAPVTVSVTPGGLSVANSSSGSN
jgi:hypothetical protein